MKQAKNVLKDKVEYLGRLVDKLTFRAFVYDVNDNQKLAKSWNEFQSLVAGGLWFAEKVIPVIQEPIPEEIIVEEVKEVVEAIQEVKEAPKVASKKK